MCDLCTPAREVGVDLERLLRKLLARLRAGHRCQPYRTILETAGAVRTYLLHVSRLSTTVIALFRFTLFCLIGLILPCRAGTIAVGFRHLTLADHGENKIAHLRSSCRLARSPCRSRVFYPGRIVLGRWCHPRAGVYPHRGGDSCPTCSARTPRNSQRKRSNGLT